jgi:hypothetical protein
MPRLVNGSKLSASARTEVLRAYLYRVTIENPQGAMLTGATMAPISDARWLATHAFYVIKDGSRLARNCHHAEPSGVLDAEER